MPTAFDRITTVITIRGDSDAYVRLGGDLGQAALSTTLEHLVRLARRRVCIDLIDVTAADTHLAVFLARVATTVAPCALLLCRPSPATRHVLELAGLDAIAVLHDNVPDGWP